ncbi:diacylglycerol kinase family protein [Ferrimicrobium sp.]|uniref:diacylglycerol/lipid kinase family protein n=1 Tax=Ferrimicrobium sp. TaxID=2926050 RepID=UPI00262459F9|nr:diacylglycerol kinase family protein [Ferrimicrobium sp.]
MDTVKRSWRLLEDPWNVAGYVFAAAAVIRLLRRGRPLAAQTVGIAAIVGSLWNEDSGGLWIGLCYGFGRISPAIRLPAAVIASLFALHRSRPRGIYRSFGVTVSVGLMVLIGEMVAVGGDRRQKGRDHPRTIVVANLDSGSTRLFRRARRIVDAKSDGGIEVLLTRGEDLPTALNAVRKLVTVGDRIIVAGGDGTVGVAIATLTETGQVLGILPTGTGNDIARSLAIPLYPEEAALVARGSGSRQVDLLTTNLGTAVHAVSVGLVADFAERVHDVHGWRRPLLYPVVAFTAWERHRSMDLAVSINGHERIDTYLNLAVVNAPRLGGRVGVTLPGGAPDDGVAQLVMISRSAWRIVMGEIGSLFRQRARRLPRHAMIEDVSELEVRAVEPFVVAIDGEPRGPVNNLSVTLIPRACRVAAPRQRLR